VRTAHKATLEEIANELHRKSDRSGSERCAPGSSFVFFRNGHTWNGREVSVLSNDRGVCTCALTDEVVEQILIAPAERRRLATITCKTFELW
jgi:hypothetical protein